MRNRLVKVISIVLSLIMSLSVFTPAVFSAGEDTLVYSVLNLVPEGEASETGYINEKWVDENGNEVEIPNGEASRFQTSRAVSVPSKYSSVEEGYVTSIKNQEQTNVCWAFSAIASAETSLLKNGYIGKEDVASDLSESHLAWFTHKSLTSDINDPTYGDGTDLADPYQKGGYWLRSTSALARGSGFALEKDYPYYASNVSLMSNLKEKDRYASNFTLNAAHEIPGTDKNAIKQAIMQEGSVLVAAHINANYLNQGDDGFAYYQNYSTSTNHEMIIVGWDDNFLIKNFNPDVCPTSNGAWLVKNSYGTTFGDNGYFWISYQDPSLGQFVVQSVSPKVENEKTYQYDGYGYNGGLRANTALGKPVQMASQANVFTAEKNEIIDAVSFYTMQDNVSYTIEIYNDVTPHLSSPTAGGIKADSVTTGFISYEGYSKIPLSKNVAVDAGESFSVVVTFSVTGSSNVLIPVEATSTMNDGVYDVYHSSKDGQSFYRFASNPWVESSGNSQLNNVCIKAFTIPDETLDISTVGEFNAFAKNVANGKTYAGINVNLTNDLDFYGKTITPIGTEDNAFQGNFLGNGFVIKNATLNSQNDSLGIFANLAKDASVTKLGVENVTVSGTNSVGIIAGQNYGTIKNCYVIGNVSGESNIGGIAGTNKGAISYCYSLADVSGSSNVGLFVGEHKNGGTYEKCVVEESSINSLGSSPLTKLNSYNINAFSSGEVAFFLDDGNTSRKNVWTKRDGITTFQKSKDEAVYRVELYAPSEYLSIYVYCTQNDKLIDLAKSARPDFLPRIYADSKCTVEYDKTPTSNIPLYVKWHSVVEIEESATCTENGIKKHYECSKCLVKAWDEELRNIITDDSEITIPATAHTEKIVAGKEATCTSDGLTEGVMCEVCDYVLTKQEVIPAFGHTVGEWKTEKEATCTAQGKQICMCTVCNEVVETKIIPIIGHIEKAVAGKEATCTSDGLTEGLECSVCGDTLVEQTVIPAIGHTAGEWQTENDATCTTQGKQYCICMVCNEVVETKTIPAIGHTEKVVLGKVATCTSEGLTNGIVCSICDEELVRQEPISATGHTDSDWIIEKQPTDNEKGFKKKICTVCGEISQQKEMPALSERFTIKCNVKTFDDGVADSNLTTITVTKVGDTTPVKTVTFEDTNIYAFTLDEMQGVTYIITVSKQNHATRTYELDVDSNMEFNMQINLVGDVTGDGQIRMNDMSIINAHIKETKLLEGYILVCADVTGDGQIRMNDMSRINAHVKETSTIWK